MRAIYEFSIEKLCELAGVDYLPGDELRIDRVVMGGKTLTLAGMLRPGDRLVIEMDPSDHPDAGRGRAG